MRQLHVGHAVYGQRIGPDVHFHLLHSAREEAKAFNNVVTEWELRPNVERI